MQITRTKILFVSVLLAITLVGTVSYYYYPRPAPTLKAGPSIHTTSTYLDCYPTNVYKGETATCTAEVRDNQTIWGSPPDYTANGIRPITPIGRVDFTQGNTPVSLCPLSMSFVGIASCSTTFYPVDTNGNGVYGLGMIVANYTGDKDHNGSLSHFNMGITNFQRQAASMTVQCNPRTAPSGQWTSCRAVVTDNSINLTTPTGRVDFAYGRDFQCFSNLTSYANASAYMSCQVYVTVTASVIASYSGDSNHLPTRAGTSITATA